MNKYVLAVVMALAPVFTHASMPQSSVYLYKGMVIIDFKPSFHTAIHPKSKTLDSNPLKGGDYPHLFIIKPVYKFDHRKENK